MQLSLLDGLPPAPDGEFRGAVKRDLGRGAWIESVPGFLRGHLRVFDLLLASADWERHRRQMYERILEVPRLVASMPGSSATFRYRNEETVEILRHRGGAEDIAESMRLLRSMATLLSQRYGRLLDHVSLAYYRDGNDSVAFHGDKLGELRKDTIVAIVSVGARRRFLLRRALPHLAFTEAPQAEHRGVVRRGSQPKTASLTFSVGEGDLFVMGGNCQETWEHAVPKSANAGPRIAIMFRESRAFRSPVPARRERSLTDESTLSVASGASMRR